MEAMPRSGGVRASSHLPPPAQHPWNAPGAVPRWTDHVRPEPFGPGSRYVPEDKPGDGLGEQGRRMPEGGKLNWENVLRPKPHPDLPENWREQLSPNWKPKLPGQDEGGHEDEEHPVNPVSPHRPDFRPGNGHFGGGPRIPSHAPGLEWPPKRVPNPNFPNLFRPDRNPSPDHRPGFFPGWHPGGSVKWDPEREPPEDGSRPYFIH